MGASACPFSTYVVKVVSRCNLNCSYCYMYNLADTTWRGQPAVMSPSVTAALAERVAAYSVRQQAPVAHFILHGGEPLMMGRRALRRWVGIVRSVCSGRVLPVFSIQSNGVLVDQAWIDLLAELDVRIGVSVDGPARHHDAYRKDHHGRGSHAEVVRAISLLRSTAKGRSIFSTVMAVVNTNIPPSELFDFWQELDTPGFDLSLPHANHTHPPPRGALSYGDWMIEFFDLWFDQNRPERRIRYFDNMLRCLFRYPHSTDNIGGRPVDVVVIETDGGIEPTDAFKSCENGLTKVGFNVLRNDFEEVQAHEFIQTLQAGAAQLCPTCSACDVRDVCGGGYMPHRYREGSGFGHPSVYCADLEQLIRHIRRRTIESFPADLAAHIGVTA